MLSFHNDIKIKQKYLDRVQHHMDMDNLVRGTGWENGKGCAVGCTLEKYDHKAYEIELGIPEWLAKVEDTLFEGMDFEKSKTWPKDFLEAIPLGVDLEKCKPKFLVAVLKHSLKSMGEAQYDKEKLPEIKSAMAQCEAAVKEMINCHEHGLDLSAAARAARLAESAAWSAARSAESAARSAAESAWSAAYNYYADELLKILRQT